MAWLTAEWLTAWLTAKPSLVTSLVTSKRQLRSASLRTQVRTEMAGIQTSGIQSGIHGNGSAQGESAQRGTHGKPYKTCHCLAVRVSQTL